MKRLELLKLNAEMLKLLSHLGLRLEDFRFIDAYEEYLEMRERGDKVEIILSELAKKYHTSESTIKRAFRRLSGEVR